MASYFLCPYLDGDVELTQERELHIAGQHPDLLPEYREQIARTLGDPDRILRSSRVGNAYLFSRWYNGVRGGKYVVVVVLTEAGVSPRRWIVTAYLARKLAGGEIVWARS